MSDYERGQIFFAEKEREYFVVIESDGGKLKPINTAGVSRETTDNLESRTIYDVPQAFRPKIRQLLNDALRDYSQLDLS